MGITPSDLRNLTLKRRLRGYDRAETEALLAGAAESYEELRVEKLRLSEELVRIRREHEERVSQLSREVDELREELGARDRRIVDLEAQLAQSEEERSGRGEELGALREELARVQLAQETYQDELLGERDRAARLETREKALSEQIAMLTSQLEPEEPAQLVRPDLRGLSEGADLATAMLLRLERALETLERQAGRQGEDGESAQYDSVAALEPAEPPAAESAPPEQFDPGAGEASWTSRDSLQ
jgi:chromosome segregation ATPase